jgi:hypothetical protein
MLGFGSPLHQISFDSLSRLIAIFCVEIYLLPVVDLPQSYVAR